MATKLKSFSFERKGRGGQYEWDDLLNGDPWLVPVTDMNSRPDEKDGHAAIVRFRRTAHSAAQKRGVKLQTEIVEDGLVIQVVGSR